jgi:hypothetical protein
MRLNLKSNGPLSASAFKRSSPQPSDLAISLTYSARACARSTLDRSLSRFTRLCPIPRFTLAANRRYRILHRDVERAACDNVTIMISRAPLSPRPGHCVQFHRSESRYARERLKYAIGGSKSFYCRYGYRVSSLIKSKGNRKRENERGRKGAEIAAKKNSKSYSLRRLMELKDLDLGTRGGSRVCSKKEHLNPRIIEFRIHRS